MPEELTKRRVLVPLDEVRRLLLLQPVEVAETFEGIMLVCFPGLFPDKNKPNKPEIDAASEHTPGEEGCPVCELIMQEANDFTDRFNELDLNQSDLLRIVLALAVNILMSADDTGERLQATAMFCNTITSNVAEITAREIRDGVTSRTMH